MAFERFQTFFIHSFFMALRGSRVFKVQDISRGLVTVTVFILGLLLFFLYVHLHTITVFNDCFFFYENYFFYDLNFLFSYSLLFLA